MVLLLAVVGRNAVITVISACQPLSCLSGGLNPTPDIHGLWKVRGYFKLVSLDVVVQMERMVATCY
jgi:hypothetical protein